MAVSAATRSRAVPSAVGAGAGAVVAVAVGTAVAGGAASGPPVAGLSVPGSPVVAPPIAGWPTVVGAGDAGSPATVGGANVAAARPPEVPSPAEHPTATRTRAIPHVAA